VALAVAVAVGRGVAGGGTGEGLAVAAVAVAVETSGEAVAVSGICGSGALTDGAAALGVGTRASVAVAGWAEGSAISTLGVAVCRPGGSSRQPSFSRATASKVMTTIAFLGQPDTPPTLPHG